MEVGSGGFQCELHPDSESVLQKEEPTTNVPE